MKTKDASSPGRMAAHLTPPRWFRSLSRLLDLTDEERKYIGSKETPMSQVRVVVEGRGNWVYTHLVGAGERVMIGRGSENDIDLNDAHVSTRHAEIIKLDDGYVLRDLGSRNGTLLNKKKITEMPLRHKDVIRIGTTRMTFLTDPEEGFGDEGEGPAAKEGYVARPEPEPEAVEKLSEEELRQELRNARVRLHRLTIANEMVRIVARQPTPLHRIRVAMQFIARQVEAENGFIMQIDPNTQQWSVRARYGAILDWSHTGEDEGQVALPMSLTIVDQVIRTGRPLISHSAVDDPRFDQAKSIDALGIHSCLCFPLVFNEKPVGVVYIDRRKSTKSFDTWEERLFQVLTDQLNRVLYPIPSAFKQ